MTYRLRNIGIAIVLAVVAALLTTFYVTNYKRSVQHGEGNVPVYVATHDIALGTSGADVAQGGGLRVEQVPRRSVVPGAISQPDQIADKVAVEAIYAGEQVSTQRFRSVQEQGIQAQLKGNLRALQVPGSATQLLNGTLKDGDHVDVVGNLAAARDEPEPRQPCRCCAIILVLEAPETNAVESRLSSNPNQGLHRDARHDGLPGHEVLVAREQRRVDAPAPAGHRSVRQPGGDQQLQDDGARRPQRTAARRARRAR